MRICLCFFVLLYKACVNFYLFVLYVQLSMNKIDSKQEILVKNALFHDKKYKNSIDELDIL